MKDTHRKILFQPYSSFPELLYNTYKERENKTAVITLDDNGVERERISYFDLMMNISWYAINLSKKYKKGDRCLIIMPAGIEFVIAFLSCLFAGIIAVPVNIPNRNKKNKKFRAIFADAEPAFIMADEANAKMLERYFKNDKQLGNINKVLVKHFKSINLNSFFKPSVREEDIAFLQYTSGSTGEPKGVMVQHINLMKNSEVITASFKHTADLVLLNWLPPYHDMGLIGNLLQPLYTGGTSVVIQPVDFLKKPSIWFKAITEYKATTTGGPNFAFDLCNERIKDEELKNFDLSSLNVFYCGSEPIRKKTLENFTRKFSVCKLKPEMLLPCYGLAEHTLMATGIDALESPVYLSIEKDSFEKGNVKVVNAENHSLELVSCGQTWRDSKIVIAEPESSEILPENETGEICIKGSSVCKGYWNDPAGSDKIFRMPLNNGGKDYYLRTGDLGFLHEGHLYITGRKKDLIIIRGVNHFPQHIEETTENCHTDLQKNACAAFSTEMEGQERLVIIQELKRSSVWHFQKEEIFESIRRSVAFEHELSVYAIELVSPASIPKTTSGKIMRHECHLQWKNKELKSLASWQQEDQKNQKSVNDDNMESLSIAGLRSWLISWIAAKSNASPREIDPSKPILSYGLDSIGMVELEREVKMKFGIRITLSDFLENNNIDHLSNIGYEDYSDLDEDED